tara:strand:+ start:214 stop:525 length:312 start_codon:yes stop_codon:yes gene_type:complete
MHVLKSKMMGAIVLPLLFISNICLSKNYKWSGKGKLYDERNQYFVTCRLTEQKRVKPFLGEDTVKCFYTCTDGDTLVITTHSDYACERQIQTPRGDYRDWRNR